MRFHTASVESRLPLTVCRQSSTQLTAITGFPPAPCCATDGARPWTRQVVHSKNTWGQEVMKQSKAAVVKIFLATAFTLGVGQQSYGQVFKCIENGRNVYSDKACSGERASMQKGAVSVMPSQTSSYSSPSTSYQSDYSGSAVQVNRGGGTAFSRSPSNPTGRQTISTLLPNGGSIDDRKKRSTQRRASPPPPPQPSVMTHCAGGFCNDNLGSQYHRIGGGMMVSPAGTVCRTVGSMVHCD